MLSRGLGARSPVDGAGEHSPSHCEAGRVFSREEFSKAIGATLNPHSAAENVPHPRRWSPSQGTECYVPDPATLPHRNARLVSEPEQEQSTQTS